MKKYIPNIITATRFILALVLILLGTTEFSHYTSALIVFVIAAISDWLDGYLARKGNITSEFGKNFDPLADKFLTLSAFIAFAINGIISLLPVIIIALRDIVNTILRYRFFTQKHVPTSNPAKFKTILQFIFIIFILLLRTLAEHNVYSETINIILNSVGVDVVMYVIAAITLGTMIEYILKIKNSHLIDNN